MWKMGFILAATMLTPTFGVWVDSDGSARSFPCPETDTFLAGKPVKLPKECVSQEPGVWLSVREYSRLNALVAAHKSEAISLRKSLEKQAKSYAETSKKSAGALSKCADELQSALDEIVRLGRAQWSVGTLSTGFVVGVAACGSIVFATKD